MKEDNRIEKEKLRATTPSKKQISDKPEQSKCVAGFLKYVVANLALHLFITPTLGKIFKFQYSTASLVGIIIFQVIFLFVLAENYKLPYMQILIDLMIKSKYNIRNGDNDE